jgi:hypothetical protein
MYYLYYYLNVQISKFLIIFGINYLVRYFARRNQLLTFYILNLFMDLEILLVFNIATIDAHWHIVLSARDRGTHVVRISSICAFISSCLSL